MNKLTLLDVKLRVTRYSPKMAHFWDGKEFTKGYPVALCSVTTQLYPRELRYFITPDEMKKIPFCQECLKMVDYGK